MFNVLNLQKNINVSYVALNAYEHRFLFHLASIKISILTKADIFIQEYFN